jgi:hypothetical protein
LSSAGDEFVVHRDKLHDVARELERDLQELRDARTKGSPSSLQHGGLATAAELGHYPAGEQIAVTCKNAHQHIGHAYDMFLNSYEAIINAIKNTAAGYDSAEQATMDAANRQQHGGGGSPTIHSAGSAG